jgi:hypothetical protein
MMIFDQANLSPDKIHLFLHLLGSSRAPFDGPYFKHAAIRTERSVEGAEGSSVPFSPANRKVDAAMPSPKGLTFATPGIYQIRVQGCLDESWSDRMNGVDIRVQDLPDEAPVTVLTGYFIDQTALAGVLNTLYDLSYPLLKVELLEAQPL